MSLNTAYPSKFSSVAEQLIKLTTGEHIVLEKDKWESDYSPASFLQRLSKREGKKYSYRRINEDTAWRITRIE